MTPPTPHPSLPQRSSRSRINRPTNRWRDGEADTGQALIDTLRKISETVHKDEGHAYRSVHAKSHGLLAGELQVLDGLPPAYAQGLFAQPGNYAAVMRFSTIPGDLLDDSVSTPRGLGIKVIGVKGDREPGTEGDVTQDFLMVNGPVFSAPTAKKFLSSLKLLAATTDKAPGLKKVLSATLRGLEALVEKAGGQSSTLIAMGGHPETNILGETYYTQVPLRHGPYMAKLNLVPVSGELTALTDAPVEVNGRPNGLRRSRGRAFRVAGRHLGTAGPAVHRCRGDADRKTASVQWPEDRSPYVAVARLVVPAQVAWSEARSVAVDDGMSFTPWHTLAAHRPIGSIMRVRKAAYAMAAQFRSQNNPTRVSEPSTLALPD